MTTKPGESVAADLVSAADDDGDALWAEADEAEGVKPSVAAEDPDGDDNFASDEETASAPAGEDGTDEPAAPAAAAAAEPDIWASASPEMIAARDKLRADFAASEQRRKSDEGRVAAFQRKALAAERELAALKAAKAEVPEEDAEALRAAQEEYPEVVKPILTRLERQQAEIDRIAETERSRQSQAAAEREARVAAETALVEAKMPDYLSLISTETDDVDEDGRAIKVRRPTPEFVAWYQAQPADVRAKIDRNADDITNAGETIEVLGAFKTFRDRFTAAADPNPAQQQNPRRQRQLQSSAAVSGRPQTGTVPGIPKDDADAAWEGFERLDQQKRQAAR